jgi:serine/threonine-protein kinase RsbW
VTERRTSVPNDAAQLAVLTEFLQEFWSAGSLPSAHAMTFELALEEVFMNVVMHGSPPGLAVQVDLSLVLADGGVTMTVEDTGPAFDPLTLATPDVEASIDDRPTGGLGVFLVREMMDTVSYQRIAGRNQLQMTKRIDS